MKFNRLLGSSALVSVLALSACGDASQDSNSESDAEANISEAMDYTITGIEPGAGITETTQRMLDEGTYDNLEGWTLEESSTTGMLAELENAINNEEPIVVTGWSPHFMFTEYDLKYLEDPETAMGEVESIHTLVRNGLQDEQPELYQILNNFSWEMEDMEEIMYQAQDGSMDDAVAEWIDNNQDTVNSWIEGMSEVDGVTVEFGASQWDSDLAGTYVIRDVLEELGYEVIVNEVDPAITFESLAGGNIDATVTPWLPITQAALVERYEGEFEDLGANVEGARLGLVVPEYMEIDSIEELEAQE